MARKLVELIVDENGDLLLQEGLIKNKNIKVKAICIGPPRMVKGTHYMKSPKYIRYRINAEAPKRANAYMCGKETGLNIDINSWGSSSPIDIKLDTEFYPVQYYKIIKK